MVMKKLVLSCSILLALVAFSAPADAAPNTNQFCFKWVVFCDGIQVNASAGPALNSDWYHFDCLNNTPMTNGSKEGGPYTSNCGGTGKGLIECDNCGGFGDWHFVIDSPLDGTLDMHQGQYPNGLCFIPGLEYTVQMGSCTGLKGIGQKQSRSSIE
jgi:hypothetical protein